MIRLGIIGAGRMGSFHLNKAMQNPRAKVVGLFDTNPVHRENAVQTHGIRAFEDLSELLFECDAVIVASPTHTHAQIAKLALQQSVPVLLEKPMASTLEEAEEIVALAREKNVLLQVGFLERFRLKMLAGDQPLTGVRSVLTERHSTSLPREATIDVCSDLMVHDIDLVLSLVGEDPYEVSCSGSCITGPFVDVAVAQLRFPSGAQATLRASRVAEKPLRVLQALTPERSFDFDFLANRVRSCDATQVQGRERVVEQFDALALQLDSFLQAVETSGSRAEVSGDDGLRAQRCLARILLSIQGTSQQEPTVTARLD